MELETLKAFADYAGFITWPLVTLVGIIKIGTPLVSWYINKKSGNSVDWEKKFSDLEQIANHTHSDQIAVLKEDLAEVKQRINQIGSKLDELWKAYNGVSNDVANIKGRMNGKYQYERKTD